MILPQSVAQVFKIKQKSYKMVLILSLIEELRVSGQVRASFDKVKERFLNYFITEQELGHLVDKSPGRERWRELTPRTCLKTKEPYGMI